MEEIRIFIRDRVRKVGPARQVGPGSAKVPPGRRDLLSVVTRRVSAEIANFLFAVHFDDDYTCVSEIQEETMA